MALNNGHSDIREQAIEAAAEAIYEGEINGTWDNLGEGWRPYYRRIARPLVDAVLAVAGPAYRAEAFEDAANLITEYAWQPGDGMAVPEEMQALYVAAVGNAVDVSARALRDRADAEGADHA